jgi:pimeloyl-ACP methyl ester carboxylesterase
MQYSVYGKGLQKIFFFHGFGLSKESYHELEEHLKNTYTIYNFDLPFHGNSTWSNLDKAIPDKLLISIICKILDSNSIDKVSLVCFSIGAKIGWNLIQHIPEKIEKCIFIAPDGIIRNLWYSVATYNQLTRRLFKNITLNPLYFSVFKKMTAFLKLYPETTKKFAESQLLRPEQRLRVYYTWTSFRNLQVKKKSLIYTLNKYNIPVIFYFGTYDRIIRHTKMLPFLQRIHNKKIITLQAGHTTILREVFLYWIKNENYLQ